MCWRRNKIEAALPVPAVSCPISAACILYIWKSHRQITKSGVHRSVPQPQAPSYIIEKRSENRKNKYFTTALRIWCSTGMELVPDCALKWKAEPQQKWCKLFVNFLRLAEVIYLFTQYLCARKAPWCSTVACGGVPCEQRHRWKACYLEQGTAFPTQGTFIKTERARQGSSTFFLQHASVLPVASHVCFFPFHAHLQPHISMLNCRELLLPLPRLICLLNTSLSAWLPPVPLSPILPFIFTSLLLAPFSHSLVTSPPLASCLGTFRLRHTWQHLPPLQFSCQCGMAENTSLNRMRFPSTS